MILSITTNRDSADRRSLYEEVSVENVMSDRFRRRNEVKIVTLKISNDLYEEINKYIDKYGYSSRSDFIRDAIKIFIRLLSILENNSPVTLDARLRDISELIEKVIRSKCRF